MSTETDRELLEWAAKAAGMDIGRPQDKQWFWCENGGSGAGLYLVNGNIYSHWNPLADDGDALRLAVKLELDVCHTPHDPPKIGVWSEVVNDFIEEERAPDPYAATRRAIVRAAAAIGKEM